MRRRSRTDDKITRSYNDSDGTSPVSYNDYLSAVNDVIIWHINDDYERYRHSFCLSLPHVSYIRAQMSIILLFDRKRSVKPKNEVRWIISLCSRKYHVRMCSLCVKKNFIISNLYYPLNFLFTQKIAHSHMIFAKGEWKNQSFIGCTLRFRSNRIVLWASSNMHKWYQPDGQEDSVGDQVSELPHTAWLTPTIWWPDTHVLVTDDPTRCGVDP